MAARAVGRGGRVDGAQVEATQARPGKTQEKVGGLAVEIARGHTLGQQVAQQGVFLLAHQTVYALYAAA